MILAHVAAVKNIKNAAVLTNNEPYQEGHAAKAACPFFIIAFTRKFVENKLQLLYNYKHKEFQNRRRHMNKKPVQILVMILIAIMFIATIVITIVWKPSPDNTSASVITSETSKIAITSLSAL